ncbi:alpha/beta hydrolase [Lentilactobacillus farraginis]|uniref:Esterase/lipase/thioesterase n=1 Tax=Lentilactobacillus farraginis DSM 18382 = JCM 14108 TaxID=1423743 RepID=X0PAR8_9LACO|nr:alpha/beta hydrolase [Lentilactobacillus farraginis]KRM08746.1 hydrolase, alpha beta domain protein [Lentilactobacillus farraginis DSM 18382 = JCM 14108]GAF36789.1 esterase/lipase/thioesterase [Lentilactobacillus farraginis DSM 18382 = JCM 14108]
MKKTLHISNERPGLWQDTNVTYAQVPGWLGHTTLDLQLTVLRQFEDQSRPLPVIFWFGGGGWMTVDHNVHLPNLVDFVRAGFVVVSVQYRNSNQAVWPAQLEDAKAAIRYIKARADDYQIDPKSVVVMGESAGGHLASMVAVTNGQKQFDVGDHLDQSSAVQAAIPWYGVVNPLSAKQNSETSDFDFVYRNLLGGEPEDHPELVSQADPHTFISDATVPFLLLHGTADEVVPVADSRSLYDDLIRHGVDADLYELTGAHHMDEAFMQPEIVKIIVAFLNKHLNN